MTDRRTVLKTIGALAAGSAMSLPAGAQASIFNIFSRDSALRDTDRDQNSRLALEAIGSNEPIMSVDTEFNLQVMAERYQNLVNHGGWPQVPNNAFGAQLGSRAREVEALRERLFFSGDLPGDSVRSNTFDAPVDAALRHFQARHGLQVTGIVDEHTFWALNVPAETRLRQLELNLERVRKLSEGVPTRYVTVNIPAATIETVEEGRVARRYTAVVGRIDRQTPILRSRIHEVNFNPYWHVPQSIIRRDIIQLMNEDPNYLTDQQIRIFDGRGNEIDPSRINWSSDEAVNYLLRQDPGAGNAMGHVRINFHNPHAVYLHDTPQRGLFAENQRFHSSGCVRVEDVDTFVAWLLRDSGYDIIDVQTAFASGERRDASVTNPVPILTTYFTAWANRNGVVSFRDDVYEFDQAGRVDFPEIV